MKWANGQTGRTQELEKKSLNFIKDAKFVSETLELWLSSLLSYCKEPRSNKDKTKLAW